MNLFPRRLRHGVLRMLGVVSPSGAYPLPPHWAMSSRGKSRWPDSDRRQQELAYAADIVASLHAKGAASTSAPLTGYPTSSGVYRSISSQPLCVSATCPGCADARDAVNGRETGAGGPC